MADICIFAGQGAQVPGMGRDFAQDPEIMNLFEKANAVGRRFWNSVNAA